MDRGAWGVLSVQSQRVGHEEQLTFSQAKIYHPGSTVVKNLPANARKHRRCGFDSWVGKMPWRSKWQPTPVFLPGKFQGQRIYCGNTDQSKAGWAILIDKCFHEKNIVSSSLCNTEMINRKRSQFYFCVL